MSRLMVVALAAAFAISSTASAQDDKGKGKKGKRGDRNPETMFKTWDVNSDGKVTLDEYKEKFKAK